MDKETVRARFNHVLAISPSEYGPGNFVEDFLDDYVEALAPDTLALWNEASELELTELEMMIVCAQMLLMAAGRHEDTEEARLWAMSTSAVLVASLWDRMPEYTPEKPQYDA